MNSKSLSTKQASINTVVYLRKQIDQIGVCHWKLRSSRFSVQSRDGAENLGELVNSLQYRPQDARQRHLFIGSSFSEARDWKR